MIDKAFNGCICLVWIEESDRRGTNAVHVLVFWNNLYSHYLQSHSLKFIYCSIKREILYKIPDSQILSKSAPHVNNLLEYECPLHKGATTTYTND